jgi:transcriptional regulator of arginine metabolism
LNKQDRLKKIREIILNEKISTQDELHQALKNFGIVTTQATLSRDMNELGVLKNKKNTEKSYYVLPNNVSEANKIPALYELIQDYMISMNRVEFMIVLKTTVGHANLIAALLDSLDIPEVLGTVAGADTMFITCRSVEAASEFMEMYKV